MIKIKMHFITLSLDESYLLKTCTLLQMNSENKFKSRKKETNKQLWCLLSFKCFSLYDKVNKNYNI